MSPLLASDKKARDVAVAGFDLDLSTFHLGEDQVLHEGQRTAEDFYMSRTAGIHFQSAESLISVICQS